MVNVARRHQNTIRKPPKLTFAMIELANAADCNDRKRMWKKYGYKDITPRFGTKSKVPSLNGKIVASKGRAMLKEAVEITPDWYVLSGHHACLYYADRASYSEVSREFDEIEYCGFFNNEYHHGRWEHSSRTEPDKGKDESKLSKYFKYEVYTRTTKPAPSSMATCEQMNPMLDDKHKSTRAARCKGIIISACNTLTYRWPRVCWSDYYPNTVFIGTTSKIASGTWVTNAVKRAAITNRSFFEDPQSILDKPGKCEELTRQLAMKYPKSKRKMGIAVMYKGKLYYTWVENGKLEVLSTDARSKLWGS